MSPCHVLGRGPGEQRLWVPMHPALGPGASVVLPLAPRGRAPAAFDLEPESLRVRSPLALCHALHALSRLFAASCASYSFSFLSPQGLSLAPQGSSSPFWPGTAALGAWGAACLGAARRPTAPA